MAIYGIADLHLDSSGEKSMDIFGENWINHEEKIFQSWRKHVKDEDLVLIPGDVSWALKLEQAHEDLVKIDELPGFKVISKGNHDYWWETKKKLTGLDLKTINFVHNDSFIYDGIAICGTRGWLSMDSEGFDIHDEKVFNRELNRLELSLLSVKEKISKKIAMIHYPPFRSVDQSPNEFVEMMKKHNVDICIYGHLHSEGLKNAINGIIEGIEFHCIASDYIDFTPKRLL